MNTARAGPISGIGKVEAVLPVSRRKERPHQRNFNISILVAPEPESQKIPVRVAIHKGVYA